MSALAPAMQAYFTDRLGTQRDASPSTIAAYCQTFRLLLGFATTRAATKPSQVTSTKSSTKTTIAVQFMMRPAQCSAR